MSHDIDNFSKGAQGTSEQVHITKGKLNCVMVYFECKSTTGLYLPALGSRRGLGHVLE